MGRPKRSVGDSTSERLLAAAEREFAARGFAGARLEDIAAEVGLTRASLLHHFPTKEALYARTVEHLVGGIREALVAGMSSRGTFRERLAATVGRFADQLCDDPTPARLFVRELQDARGEGERLLREKIVPLVELAHDFIRVAGGKTLPDDLDVRAAILDLVGAILFFAITGSMQDVLWGTQQRSREDIRAHFIGLAERLFLSPEDL